MIIETKERFENYEEKLIRVKFDKHGASIKKAEMPTRLSILTLTYKNKIIIQIWGHVM